MTLGGIITMCISIGTVWILFGVCVHRLVKKDKESRG